jgi:CRP-like cAMP-binding protein
MQQSRSESMPTQEFKNSLLKALDRDILQRLPLRPVSFAVGREIEFPGKPINHLYFVEEGMASQTVTFGNGVQVEVGMFGYESVIGVSALMGTKQSLNRVYTQIAGTGYSCSIADARAEFGRCQNFQTLALRYVQAQLVQVMQSAACNAKHEVEQRLARWLLICADRAHSDSFKMSQEYLAEMLGSTRPTVTDAAGHLKAEGLIEYNRGKMHIHNSKGLEARACECYQVIRQHLDNYAAFDSGIVA